ncbi:nuclear transport factor 2 family protein [Stenotrophobium rhamnosiphilum]|uniref:Nuclear transport factor 2 family protein n=1 Tax=Stenotrophobium rhamnosiphilum TaxID=2029166 RepID=A0A2T5MJ51_9GAMM|nr:nuclear transport factor 2 family protein [Stenotrophobium rhamnosiphilum]PTU32600.1 nuclear transport factor 2 family protein [Stenotrophobium rhamnosiphilum]
MNSEQAKALTESWVAAWNAHDLPRILSHYSDDFEMTSPYIVQITGDASGTLRGKAAVGAYWQKALEKFPDLQFESQHVLYSPGSVTLIYRSNRSGLAAEVFFVNDDDKIFKAVAHYLA